IIPISDIKKYLTNGILTTHLEYFSASNTLKYNLIGEFDTKHKTLKFENVLLQSFTPKELARDEGNHHENRYVHAIKRRIFKLSYILFGLLPVCKRNISIASDSIINLSAILYFSDRELYIRIL